MKFDWNRINPFKNRYCLLAVVALFFCLIVVSRRPDAVTYPQFYAEDGVYWYSEAYNADHFWEPFFIPKQKYFQTVSRVGGMLGNSVNILYAPLLLNLMAISIQVLTAVYFLSSRFNSLIPRFHIRFLCSLAYLLLLGSDEIHANLTNSMSHLALLMFLIIIVPQSRTYGWRFFDYGMLLLAGLSGPFVFFALPVAVAFCGYRKSIRNSAVKLAILAVTFLIQFYSYLFIVVPGAMRSDQTLGANFGLLIEIMARNIFIRGISGTSYVPEIMGLGIWSNGLLPILVVALGVAVIGRVLWKAELELKFFIIFSFMIFTAALITPQVSLVKPQWGEMAMGGGGRYYFLPTLTWVISLGWLLFNAEHLFLRCIAGALIACMLIAGLPGGWVLMKYNNYNYKVQVQEFNNKTPGRYSSSELPLIGICD